jgi:mono/diheme cytochrome c family protein
MLPLLADPPAAPAPSARRMAAWKIALLTTLALAVAGALAGAVVVFGGLYNVAATAPHLQPTYSLLERAMRSSVRLRAAGIEVPPLDSPVLVERGAACFRDHCVQCHGAPGVAPHDFSKSLQPVPSSLISAPREWRTRELYWITRHGIKMSGMPAWEFRMADADMWAVVAFVRQLPMLGTAAYSERMGSVAGLRCDARPQAAASEAADSLAGNAGRGRVALLQYGCTACHAIPGVAGPDIHVGTPLAGLGEREWIAGRLPNNTENLVRWIREPQRVDPASAMPDMGVTHKDARDMAAYLGSLR